jgi:hypothetical protein
MTTAQAYRFYFPAWSACVKANAWHMEDGRLVGNGLSDQPSTINDQLPKVLTFARQIAQAQHRGPMVDDLRHACHIVALGRDKSSKVLNNAELDRVVALFKLLADPEDLSAIMAWENPVEADVKRVKWFITNTAPSAYVAAIARDKFGTSDWESLDLKQMRFLAMTLANRRDRKHSKIPSRRAPEPEVPAENCPF